MGTSCSRNCRLRHNSLESMRRKDHTTPDGDVGIPVVGRMLDSCFSPTRIPEMMHRISTYSNSIETGSGIPAHSWDEGLLTVRSGRDHYHKLRSGSTDKNLDAYHCGYTEVRSQRWGPAIGN